MSPGSYGLVTLCALGALALPASAADPSRAQEIHQRYLEERALCAGKSGDERKTCLREAGAAQIEARRGTLAEENADYAQNRLARCAWHKRAEEREYCERRMRGEGSVSGSVQEGGILRELTVIVPAR